MKGKMDELLFADELELTNDKETLNPILPDYWKVLIVDDDEEVHNVTKLALKRFVFEGKPIRFFSAYSASQGRKILTEHSDMAVILLDVVMEEEDAGLKMAQYIRSELDNKMVRIILRTGQPGQAPEHDVIMEYDINDYKEKTELTTQKLHTTMVTALRSFQDLSIIDTNRKGLQKIIESSATIFQLQSMTKFASGALSQLVALLHLNPNALYGHASSFAATKQDVGGFQVLAATGEYESMIGSNIAVHVGTQILQDIENAYNKKESIYFPDRFVIYFRT
jgi:CheY-like chemotaxis protein